MAQGVIVMPMTRKEKQQKERQFREMIEKAAKQLEFQQLLALINQANK